MKGNFHLNFRPCFFAVFATHFVYAKIEDSFVHLFLLQRSSSPCRYPILQPKAVLTGCSFSGVSKATAVRQMVRWLLDMDGKLIHMK